MNWEAQDMPAIPEKTGLIRDGAGIAAQYGAIDCKKSCTQQKNKVSANPITAVG